MPPSPLARVPKDYRPFIRAALDAGWTWSQSRAAHIKLRHPDGRTAMVPTSSVSGATFRNVRARLRRMGLDV